MEHKVEQVKELVGELNHHRHAYYNLNAPTITDKEYDQLFDRLKTLEIETGVILSNSPTQTVGYYPVSSLAKVQHPVPLLSLDKTKQVSEIRSLLARNFALLMLKLDGLTTKVRNLNPAKCAKRCVYFTAFNILEGLEEHPHGNSRQMRLSRLKLLGFDTCPYMTIEGSTPSEELIKTCIETLRAYQKPNPKQHLSGRS